MEYVRSPFEPAELEALSRLAERHLRPVPNEVRHIVREALQQAGLLQQAAGRQPAEHPPRQYSNDDRPARAAGQRAPAMDSEPVR